MENIDAKVPSAPTTIYRKDYKPTPYQVDQVDLTFQLNEDATVVTSQLKMRPTHNGSGGPQPIVFNGTFAPFRPYTPWLPIPTLCLSQLPFLTPCRLLACIIAAASAKMWILALSTCMQSLLSLQHAAA